MTDDALQHPKLFHFLLSLDDDLAARARVKGCTFCGGVLHSARYPRTPRGGPLALEGTPTMRHSFCCESCRRRTTPPSVRFLGRRVYPGFIMVLLSAMQSGVTDPLVAELRAAIGVTRRTLQRWRHWWREIFIHTALWRYEQGNFMPTIDVAALPLSLLERFVSGDGRTRIVHLLRFLMPISVPGGFNLHEGR